MNCKRFGEIQVAALVGEASAVDWRAAAAHASTCAPCRRAAERDRTLDAALTAGRRRSPEGYAHAARALRERLDDRRAICTRVEGPFGRLYLARTSKGLCRLSFRHGGDEEFLTDLESREMLADFDPPKLAGESRQLRNYLSGRSTGFDMPLDLRFATAFQQRVLGAASKVPFGRVVSYSDIARRIGQPGARRAVGSALGRNPIPIVIPCHRVVAGDGTLGGYTGGLDIKRTLMRIEGIAVPDIAQ